MAKCAACGKFMPAGTGGASCTMCPLKFHKGCVAITETGVISPDWSCPECKKKQRRGDNSSTPVKGICGTQATIVSGDSHIITATVAPDSDSEMRALRRELAEFMAEQRKQHSDFRSAIANIAARMDAIERRLDDIENRESAAATIASNEVEQFQQTVAQLHLQLNDRDQEALLSDLDIGLLPEVKGENVLHTVTVLATKLGVAIEPRDIVFAERVGAVGASTAGDGGSRGTPRRVIVRLARRHLRDELLQAARVRRNINAGDLGFKETSNRVYINERLTKTNRIIFHRVREECRKRQWRYSWTKRGRIFAKQADGKPVHSVRTEADITRVFGINSV